MHSPLNRLHKNSSSLLFILLLWTSHSVFAGGNPVSEVEILKFEFIPQKITVKAGSTIRWTNKEKRQYHSVWFEQAGDPEPQYFFPGETFERSFDKPGVYPYRCGPHPKMTGTVVVE
ncbi:MAG: cupredoxin domain-containing protein [Sedimenticola sp.]|nr:cupredoxin domain-containing protein [Sedimenticola sp.]